MVARSIGPVRTALLAALGVAALAACDTRPAPEPPADPASPAPGAGAVEEGTGIPAMMQGRWGLVAADCEADRPDAKGLMIVSADSLEFYESMATLIEVSARSADALRASFAFTGEGMSWDREMTITLEQGGEALVRREFGADAAPEPLEYRRCA